MRNSYLLHPLSQNSRRATERRFLLGWSDPRVTLGTQSCAKVGSLQPNSVPFHGILSILSCATSSPSGTCPITEVNAKVTIGVICVFHAPVTFQPCEWRSTFLEVFESDTSKRPRKWKSSIKMFPSDLRETVLSIFMVEGPPSALYLLGNLQPVKSEKELQSVRGPQAGTAMHSPLLI